MNPSPGRLLSQRQDTTDGCRDRPFETPLHAANLVSGSERETLHESAAKWTQRAELLQKAEHTKARLKANLPKASTKRTRS
jgi:hypothetical protein